MITYDLHVHTCLSPDADDSMTPVKVVDKAIENGLDMVAITDHNSITNARAAWEYAYDKDITVIPGIEVCSSEEVHVVCLFPDILSASRMARVVTENMYDKNNKPKTFGRQIVMDEFDDVIEEEPKLLLFSTKMTIEEIFYVARQMNGVALYAHMDDKASSVLAVLGRIPGRPEPKGFEYTNNEAGRKLAGERADEGKFRLFSSNAHSLDKINTSENSEDIEAAAGDIRDADGCVSGTKFIEWLRSYEGI